MKINATKTIAVKHLGEKSLDLAGGDHEEVVESAKDRFEAGI